MVFGEDAGGVLALRITGEPRHIHADIGGECAQILARQRAILLQQSGVEFGVIPLIMSGQRISGGQFRGGAEHRELFDAHLHLMRFYRGEHGRQHALAIAALVVEKLHHQQLALPQ